MYACVGDYCEWSETVFFFQNVVQTSWVYQIYWQLSHNYKLYGVHQLVKLLSQLQYSQF